MGNPCDIFTLTQQNNIIFVNITMLIIVAVLVSPLYSPLPPQSLPPPSSHIEQHDGSWQKSITISIHAYSFRQMHTARFCYSITFMLWMRSVFLNVWYLLGHTSFVKFIHHWKRHDNDFADWLDNAIMTLDALHTGDDVTNMCEWGCTLHAWVMLSQAYVNEDVRYMHGWCCRRHMCN